MEATQQEGSFFLKKRVPHDLYRANKHTAKQEVRLGFDLQCFTILLGAWLYNLLLFDSSWRKGKGMM